MHPSIMRSIRSAVAALAIWVMSAACLATVEFTGLNSEQRANVRAMLYLTGLGCDAPVWMVRWRFNESDREIRRALEALGYYNVEISKSLQFEEDCWVARYEIDPGEPVRIVSVDVRVDGPLAEEPAVMSWRRRVSALEGERLHHGTYEAYRTDLLEIARELGYFDAEYVTRRVEVDPETLVANVRLHFISRERYRFGEITFDNEPLRADLLMAYVPFAKGDPYSSRMLGRLRRNLADSGYFAGVQVDASVDDAVDREVPVHIKLILPTRERTYSVGGGFATDTGPRVRGDLHVRRHNDRGHRSEWRLFLSMIQIAAEGAYQIPREDPLNDRFTIEGGLIQEDTETAFSRIARIGLRHTYDRRNWIETDFVDVRVEAFEVADVEDVSRLVIVGKNWSRTWGDSGMRPMDAVRLGGELRGAVSRLGSDTDFIQMRVNARYIRRLFGNVRMLTRLETGGTIRSEFEELPPSVRFFAGGDNSVRGYGFRSLGTERDGEVIGGSHLLTGAVEIDVAVASHWSVAAFLDSGTAFTDALDFSTGAGLGVRWYSPIGPVRLDIAHPFDDTRSFRVHLSLGPDI
jgi:translocation and assembly module TamA